MNWRWKARIQRAIATLPAADRLHYVMQRSVGSLRPGLHDPSGWFSAAARMVRWITESGRQADGKRFLEVGTGRTVDLPMGLWLAGAGDVVTVDPNRYFADALVRESLRFVQRRTDDVRACFGEIAHSREFEARLARLLAFDGDMASLMRVMNVTYLSPADATRLPLPAGSVDYHISYAVLEHVPPETITAILTEARRVLTPGGLLVHVIDPSDHFSHEDPSITAINFLQFSEREWRTLAGNKFAYHNRLRADAHVELFRRAGARVVQQLERTDEASLLALRNGFRVDGAFAALPAEQLAIVGVTIVAELEEAPLRSRLEAAGAATTSGCA